MPYRLRATLIGLLIGVLVVLVDIMLKGFSLRGLSAITFGLAVGALVAFFLSSLAPVQVRRPAGGVSFPAGAVPGLLLPRHGHRAAGQGRIQSGHSLRAFCAPRCGRARWSWSTRAPSLTVAWPRSARRASSTRRWSSPALCWTELQHVADSTDPLRQARGRRGLEVLNDLRRIKNLDLRIHESEVSKRQDVDAKLVFLAQSMRAKLLTTDYNLAKMAEFHGVPWLNLNHLAAGAAAGTHGRRHHRDQPGQARQGGGAGGGFP